MSIFSIAYLSVVGVVVFAAIIMMKNSKSHTKNLAEDDAHASHDS